jgi:hypothetical protein
LPPDRIGLPHAAKGCAKLGTASGLQEDEENDHQASNDVNDQQQCEHGVF